MGALYYGAFQDQPTLERAAKQALEPSLDEVTTAFVRRDIFEVGGLRVGPDRGAALEESWERRLGDVPKSSVTMRSWSEAAADFAGGVGHHRPFPAFLFNSTIVESGQPIVFATTQFPTPSYKIAIGMTASHYPTLESANSMFGLSVVPDKAIDIGLKAVTAARISAAFPYVSPAVRLENREPYHLVDGGYYDFYGLVALSQWVDNALEELDVAHQLPPTLGVIIARGLVSSDTALRANDAANPIALKAAPRGWRWQLTAPPATVVNAQSFAQWAGGMQTLRMLIEKWAARQVKIIPVLFDYPGGEHKAVCQGSPLSWKLTEPQRTCISSAWHSFVPNDTVNPLPEDLR